MASCAFCPEPLNMDDEENYREVKSWVTGPKLDGPVLREQTGAVAHKKCIQALLHGQAPDQPVLFEAPVERCEANAMKGTGWGICDHILTPQGDCPNGENHAF